MFRHIYDIDKYYFRSLFFFVLFFYAFSAQASNYIAINDIDILDMQSITLNDAAQTVNFRVNETLTGVSTTYFIDLDQGNWFSVDSVGNSKSGSIPPSSQMAWSIPCFTSPWAFAGCLAIGSVGSGFGAWYCGRRDATMFGRASSACGGSGIQSFNSGTCGFGASFTCRPLDALH